jgi:predicted nucleic acid-binding protein
MVSSICVDANVFVKVLVQEELSDLARLHWERWTIAEGRRVIVPALFLYEVVAVLRKKVYQGQLALEDGSDAVDILLDANLELVTASELHRRAWELAQRLHRPTAYDAHYLALAEMEHCEFWTADGRLYNSVKDHFPLIRWLGESEGSL